MNTKNQNNVDAIILAAGKGSRMGRPKWQLKMRSGQNFYSFLCCKYIDFNCETVIVVNHEDVGFFKNNNDIDNIKIAVNDKPELGRMYSVKCGLLKLGNYRNTFIHNTDNPFLNNTLINLLNNNIANYDYVLPQFNDKGGHPLLISSATAEMMSKLKSPYPNIRAVLKKLKAGRIDFPNSDILLNINTPEDYNGFLNTSSPKI